MNIDGDTIKIDWRNFNLYNRIRIALTLAIHGRADIKFHHNKINFVNRDNSAP